jgi:glycosyltransferase involved in cell wall biosynthesis
MNNKKLLVIIPDHINDILKKGEYPDRYYNPGNLFDEVHILPTNDDQPDPEALQKTVGNARLYLHNLPMPSFVKTLGNQPEFIQAWIQKGIQIAGDIQPALIRTHGNYHNGYLAAQIKKKLGIPLVVSVHTNPDLDLRRTTPWWRVQKRVMYESFKRLEKESLSSADRVIIVYESQRGYALKYGARDIRLIYNVVNPGHLKAKTDYALRQPARIVSVGRLFKDKNPENLIRALAELNAVLTMIGDGPYRNRLADLVKSLELEDKVNFIQSMPNDVLAASLADYDIFATHCDSAGIPKAVIEPLLVGLPVVINRNPFISVPELEGDWVCGVENSTEGYRAALAALLKNSAERKALGQRAYAYARRNFSPQVNEQKLVSLYNELL